MQISHYVHRALHEMAGTEWKMMKYDVNLCFHADFHSAVAAAATRRLFL